MFPEFLPVGLIGRPYGGVKTEPPDVRAEQDLPGRFMFDCLQKGSFRKTKSSWWASCRHPTREIRAEVAGMRLDSPLSQTARVLDDSGFVEDDSQAVTHAEVHPSSRIPRKMFQ